MQSHLTIPRKGMETFQNHDKAHSIVSLSRT